jgi:amino acid adenylation domain-containing protein
MDNQLSAPEKRALLAKLLQKKASKTKKLQQLSYGQQALWFLYQSAPDSAAYNTAFTVRICSSVDVQALRRVFQTLMARHPSLRSTFTLREGEPVQEVHGYQEIYFEEVNASASTDNELYRQVIESYQRPFNLENGPVLRVSLFTRRENDHILLLAIQHIVCDAWSIWLLVDEFLRLYSTKKSTLSPLRHKYADYIQWQNQMLNSAPGEQLWAYWQKQLTGELPILELPTDRARPPVQSYKGKTYAFTLSQELTQQLDALAKSEGATLYMTLLAAFQVLLYRYTGQEDILVGSPTTGRTQADFAGIVGFFVNQIVLRANLEGNPSFVTFLSQVRKTVLAALAHQDYPFYLLVKKLQPIRDPSRSPIFQAYFVLQKQQQGELSDLIANGDKGSRLNWGGLEIEPFEIPQMEGQFDLTLELMEIRGSLSGVFKYNPDLYDETTIARMLGHFRTLLEAIVSEPQQCISQLPLLTQTEQQQLLIEWNATQVNYPKDKCLHQLIETQVEKTPDACAVVFENKSLTYRQLNQKANQLAYYLQSLGVGPESLVGISMERSLEMVYGLLGILKAGGAYVPLEPSYPKERLAFMLEDSQIAVLLTQTPFVKALSESSIPIIDLNADWEKTVQFNSENPLMEVKPANLAYVIYTSGSTGQPKGAMNTHLGICNRLLWMQDAYQLSVNDRVLQKTPFSFDVSVWEFFWPLMTGARLVMAKQGGHQDRTYLAQIIREQKVTTLHFVPSMLRVFLETPAPDFEKQCQTLRQVICSGEALTPDLQERFFTRLSHCELYNLYGPTEAAIDVTAWHCQRDRPSVPIGRPIANTQLYILDPYLQPVPIGIAGELHIGGLGLARAYLNRPELTAAKFIPNPFNGEQRLYKTGDLARYLSDGNIEYLGRLDHQVKIRGVRIELGEIETVLTQHAEVQEAVVVVHEKQGDKRLVAYFVASAPQSHSDLQDYLKARLPEYMVPSVFVWLEALPLTPNGKLDRRALPEPADERPDLEAAYVSPQTETEQQIAAIWQSVLQLKSVGLYDNFFDLGGHSLLIARVHSELQARFGPSLSMVELFQYPTIQTLAKHLTKKSPDQLSRSEPTTKRNTSQEIAIIGLACRFPGANNIEAFWQNLRDGVESIQFLTDEELLASGIEPSLLHQPNYVKAHATLSDIDLFDATFFDYTPREAEIMDPQQRLFLECAWEAIESAGYNVDHLETTGVFAGVGMNTYLFNNLYPNPELINSVGGFQLMISNDKDFLATRLAYKLNLKGPCMSVQTACSTSLVAVHLACQSLLKGECKMALAGGVAIRARQNEGYLYQEGMILSPDGHCRAFDAKAQGTVGGNGVGIVVLKRLEDALGDEIHAVIKNSAMNNDGALKVGYTAPSVEGQRAVITDAMQNLDYETISYIETHGTGTVLGDPIEIAALTQAYQSHTQKKGFCPIGSVKTNIGHLDAAAGVAGLIKTVLALKHQMLPPSLHFEQANPKIDFDNTPFYVNQTLSEWQSIGGAARRAGVSSFGIGGTNVHLVLEEAPSVPSGEKTRDWQLLVLSAKTDSALEAASLNLAQYLEQHPDIHFGDVAYTLSQGRKVFNHRRTLVCQTLDEAIQALSNQSGLSQVEEVRERAVVFMFSGQGSQYVNMALALYQHESIFREQVNKCADILKPHLKLDIRQVLYPQTVEASQQLEQTALTQPALFVIEYALAQLWMAWGVRPVAMIGHSIGEYVAACLAGVFSLEEALALVAARGQMMQALPGGAMLSVSLSETEINPILNQALSLAAINAPSLCVVSGPFSAIQSLEKQLSTQNIKYQRLQTSHAFHSSMMESILAPFTSLVNKITLNPPQIPYLSNVTGTWITEATDPVYWAKHLRQTVRFADGIQKLLKRPEYALLEIGPGRTLTSLVQQHTDRKIEQVVLNSIRHPKDRSADVSFLLTTLGKLWLSGVSIDWGGFYAQEQRLPLPTYPFERQRYWVESAQKTANMLKTSAVSTDKKPDIADWFYLPSWKRSVPKTSDVLETSEVWLVFVDEYGLGSQLVKQLEQQGQKVMSVEMGMAFTQLSERHYCLNPGQGEDYDALFKALDKIPENIVYFWPVNTKRSEIENLCFYSLLFLVQALGTQGITDEITLSVISNNMQQVAGETVLYPEKALLLGPVKVIRQEYPNISCRSIDVVLPNSGQEIKLINQLYSELMVKVSEPVIAYRDNHRWVQTFEPVQLEPSSVLQKGILRKNGVYLITGGLGGIGLVLAEHLAKTVQAKLILTGRSVFPKPNEWTQWIASHDKDDAISHKIKKLQTLETFGAQVLIVSADVANQSQMQAVLAQNQFGQINGVIHAAGVPSGGMIQGKTRAMMEPILAAKVRGTQILAELSDNKSVDFMVLFSSLSSIRGDFGQVDYCAANAFMDAFTHQWHSTRFICINWDSWQAVGMAASADLPPELQELHAENLQSGILPAEGVEVFERILAHALPQLVVSTRHLDVQFLDAKLGSEPAELKAQFKKRNQRSGLQNAYVAPTDEIEKTLADIWQELLGIEPIGIHDDFFELGGHSLLATQVISRMREAFGVTLPLPIFFEVPTIVQMAEQIVIQQLEPMESDAIKQILAEVDDLSDDDVKQQLGL